MDALRCSYFCQEFCQTCQCLLAALDGTKFRDNEFALGGGIEHHMYSQTRLLAQSLEGPRRHEMRTGAVLPSTSVGKDDAFRFNDFAEHAAVGIVGAVRAVHDMFPYTRSEEHTSELQSLRHL